MPMGTFGHMSPEIVFGTGQYDANADVWSAGAALFSLLKGGSEDLVEIVGGE